MGPNLSAAERRVGRGMKVADVAAQTVKSASSGLLHKCERQTVPPHTFFASLKRSNFFKTNDEQHRIFVAVRLGGLPQDDDAPTESHWLLVTHVSSGEARLASLENKRLSSLPSSGLYSLQNIVI